MSSPVFILAGIGILAAHVTRFSRYSSSESGEATAVICQIRPVPILTRSRGGFSSASATPAKATRRKETSEPDD